MSTPVSKIKSDDIWFKNIHVLYKFDRLVEFFPNKLQTLEERMNSIVRLGIYSSILLASYKRNWSYLLIIIITLVITYFIYKNYKKENFEPELKGILKKKEKVKPTYNNPFMNTTFDDYTKNPEKDEVDDYYQDTLEAQALKDDINEKFNYGLFKDVEDVYDRNNSRRQFYTTPNTRIPSDQDKYLNFLYGELKSCKTNPEDCNVYNDLKRNPFVFPDKESNPIRS